MRDKERAKNYNTLYRKQHCIAIAIKNRMYKNLPHIKERRRQQNRLRKDYFKKYYQEHKDYFRIKSSLWVKENPQRRRLILKRYAEKLRKIRLKVQKRLKRKTKLHRVISDFIEYCKQRYAKDTVRQYKTNLERFLSYIDRTGTHCKEYHARWYKEHKKPAEERDLSWAKEYHKIRMIEDIDREFITNYVSYVNHNEVNTKNVKLNQPEKESRLYPLKTFLLYCLRKGFLKEDLRKFIIVPRREDKVLKRVLTQEEMKRLIEVADTSKAIVVRDRALLELSYSGLRANELLTLKLGHVDLETNSVTILNAKGDKDRVVPMTSEAIFWIKRWLNIRAGFINNRPDEEYLFITKGAKTIPRRNFSKLIKRYAKKAAIPIDVAPHDLRRATATHLAENGAPIRLIQALLGHATLKVTTRYLRLSDERIKKVHKETHPSNRRNLYYGALQG